MTTGYPPPPPKILRGWKWLVMAAAWTFHTSGQEPDYSVPFRLSEAAGWERELRSPA